MLLISNKLIVFPTSRAIREAIKKRSNENLLLPSYLTIDELFKKSISISNKKYIDEEQRFLYLKTACDVKRLQKLGISNNFTSFLKQSDYLFRFFGELSAEKVSIDSLQVVDTYEYYKEHIEILKEIYTNYTNILNANDAIDKINLPSNYEINSNFLDRYESIEIYFEGYFTNFELEIILKISKQIKTIINLSFNKYNEKSIQSFIELGFDLECEFNYKIDLTNKEILQKEEQISYLENIKISAFTSRINQVAFIKESITHAVNSGIDAQNIVLVVPDEKFISIIEQFDDEGYFNYAMGKSITNSKIYKFLSSIYNYLNEDERKTKETVEFYDIDIALLDSLKTIWNKSLQKDDFNLVLEYLKSIEHNKELIEKFDELIYKLNHLFFNTSQKIVFKEAVKILIQKTSKISLDDINSGMATVMGLLETRAVDYEAVIICDFNETFIPKSSIKDKFLSSAIKKRAKLPTQKDRENLQKYYYYKLINSAKNLYISYTQNETMQISRFADELFKDKIDNQTKDKEYKEILYKNKNINHFDEEIIYYIDLSKQEWSATSLKKYLECKRKYYLEYIYKIKEHNTSLKPRGYELGSMVHKTLESAYKSFEVKNIDFELIKSLFEKHINHNPFLLLDKEVFLKRLNAFVEFENKRFEDKNLEVLEIEKDFKFDFNGIVLKGSIDRIDKLDDQYLLIDYKTSSNLKIDSLKTYDKSADFQLEFYYLACRELFGYDKIKAYYYDLNSSRLLEEVVLQEKIEVLKNIFIELKTKKINFEKCEKTTICQYCEFKTICNR
ncbi:MAG: PD-(D/E)XK nuclease family protein [Arcobacter sp.]|uniref:PD-(D/E)XK nuclease family protein n=1 Tax=Arcobacter sp. TaxID=1872629 RepID=UPI003AFF7B9E